MIGFGDQFAARVYRLSQNGTTVALPQGGAAAGAFDDSLPAGIGTLFDLNPRLGITVDQVGGFTLSNASGLTVGTDAILPHEVIECDGGGVLETTNGSPVVDHSVAVPYTWYFAYRASELDGAGAAALFRSSANTSNYAESRWISEDEIRIRVQSAAGAGFHDSTSLNREGQNFYVISVSFLSLTTIQLAVDDEIASVIGISSRDPLDFLKTVLFGQDSSSFRLAGEVFRVACVPGARNAEVAAVFATYQGLWSAGADLSEATGVATFDFRPVETGDYGNARDETGGKVLATVVNGFGGIGTTDGFPHLKPTAASDEMLLYDYPGAADINAVGEPAPQRLLLMVAFRPSGTGEQTLMTLGTNVVGTSRLWVGYNADTGIVTAGYRDAGGSEHTLSSTGAVSLGGSAVVACAEFAQTTGGTVTQLIVGIPGVGTVTLNGASLGDVTFSKLILAGQYSAQTTLTSDASLLGAVVIESQDYTEALALQFLNSVRPEQLASTLSYGGPDSASLVGWWSATEPLVSAEGNDYQTTVEGSPASELGTHGGRAYHQPTAIANGYTVPMNGRTLANGGVLTVFTLWRNPSTGGSTSSDRLGTLYGSGASDRPTLYCATNYSPKWAQGAIINDSGITNIDTMSAPYWSNDTVHVTMSRITKAADGLSYSQSVGLDGTFDASPSARTSSNLVGTFVAFGPGNPGLSNHHTGMQVFDVAVFDGVVDYAGISSYFAGLVS